MSSLIVSLFWLLLFVGGGIFLAYQRIDLRTSTIAAGLAVLAYTVFGEGSFLWKLLLWAGFGAMIVPNLIALAEDDVKRMPAYSSIAHTGYLLVGLTPGTTEGAAAVLFYLATYAVMNLGAFGIMMLLARRRLRRPR